MRQYLADLADSKRRSPGTDLLSALVGDNDEPMNEAELLSFCVTMLTAGHETTTSLIGNGMLALLGDPEALAALRAAPELMDAAVEELLRFDAPLQRTWRRVSADAVFRGAELSADELVVVFLGSANRDASEFTDPDRLDFSRPTNRHVGLGAGSLLPRCTAGAVGDGRGPVCAGQPASRRCPWIGLCVVERERCVPLCRRVIAGIHNGVSVIAIESRRIGFG